MDNKAKALAAALLFCVVSSPARATGDARNLSGLHDFDFLHGDWVAHHRQLKARLAGSNEWIEFEGRFTQRPLMDGFANSGDNLFGLPSGEYRGVSLRFYDAKSAEWTVWWLDGRNPAAPIGAPIRGRFENGIGRFYSADTLRGKPIRVRVEWTRPTPLTARWEQAFSDDDGKTWEVNWTTDLKRPPDTQAFSPDGGTTRETNWVSEFTKGEK